MIAECLLESLFNKELGRRVFWSNGLVLSRMCGMDWWVVGLYLRTATILPRMFLLARSKRIRWARWKDDVSSPEDIDQMDLLQMYGFYILLWICLYSPSQISLLYKLTTRTAIPSRSCFPWISEWELATNFGTIDESVWNNINSRWPSARKGEITQAWNISKSMFKLFLQLMRMT